MSPSPVSRLRFYLIGFFLLLAFDTLAQVSFKYVALSAEPFSPDFVWLMRVLHSPWLLGCICGYLGAFFTWMTLLEHAPVGPAFAASHLEIVTVMLVSAPLFGEHLSLQQLVGAAVIVAGVACLAVSESKDAPHDSA